MLFLGVFLQIVIACKAHGVYNYDIVAAMMSVLDPSFSDKARILSPHLVDGSKNPPASVLEAASSISPASYKSIIGHFENKVIPCIDDNKLSLLLSALSLLVSEDTRIEDDTIICIFSGLRKKDISKTIIDPTSFLAGIFVYTLKSTSNRQPKDLAKSIAQKFIVLAEAQKTPLLSPTSENRKDYDNESDSKKSQLPRTRLFSGHLFSSPSIAFIISKWDEKNTIDREFIEKLTGKLYSDFYEDLRSQPAISVSCKNGIVTCLDTSAFRLSFIEDVDYPHMHMLFDVLMEVLSHTSDFICLSSEFIEGIVDFLAYVGCNIKHSQRLGQSSWKSLLHHFIERLFDEPHWIQLFSKELEILAEADFSIYLDILDEKIATCNSILLGNIKNQSSFIYPLAYSLRKAAGSKDCFSFSMQIMFDLVEYSSVFTQNLTYTILPTLLQTEASQDVREGVLRKFFIQNENMAWHLLMSLLPGYNRETIQISECRYYPLQINKLSYSPKDEAKFYISLACMNIDGKIQRAVDLIRMMPFFSIPETKEVTQAISDSIKPSKDTTIISDTLVSILSEEYTYSKEKKYLIEKLNNSYSNAILKESVDISKRIAAKPKKGKLVQKDNINSVRISYINEYEFTKHIEKLLYQENYAHALQLLCNHMRHIIIDPNVLHKVLNSHLIRTENSLDTWPDMKTCKILSIKDCLLQHYPEKEAFNLMLEFLGRTFYHTKNDEDDFVLNRQAANLLEFSNNRKLLAFYELEIMESITPINLDPKMNMPAQIINEIDKNACQLEKEGYLRVARAYRNVGEMLRIQFEE